MASTRTTTFQKILLSISGFIFLVGFLFFMLWVTLQIDWLLWVSGLATTVFLIMPGLLLIFQPDTAIVYLNSIVALFFRPHVNRMGQLVNMGPPPRLIEKGKWNHLSGGEQIWVILGICLIAALGLLVMRFTFGPMLLQQIVR